MDRSAGSLATGSSPSLRSVYALHQRSVSPAGGLVLSALRSLLGEAFR